MATPSVGQAAAPTRNRCAAVRTLRRKADGRREFRPSSGVPCTSQPLPLACRGTAGRARWDHPAYRQTVRSWHMPRQRHASRPWRPLRQRRSPAPWRWARPGRPSRRSQRLMAAERAWPLRLVQRLVPVRGLPPEQERVQGQAPSKLARPYRRKRLGRTGRRKGRG